MLRVCTRIVGSAPASETKSGRLFRDLEIKLPYLSYIMVG